jgi:hypothetical protein
MSMPGIRILLLAAAVGGVCAEADGLHYVRRVPTYSLYTIGSTFFLAFVGGYCQWEKRNFYAGIGVNTSVALSASVLAFFPRFLSGNFQGAIADPLIIMITTPPLAYIGWTLGKLALRLRQWGAPQVDEKKIEKKEDKPDPKPVRKKEKKRVTKNNNFNFNPREIEEFLKERGKNGNFTYNEFQKYLKAKKKNTEGDGIKRCNTESHFNPQTKLNKNEPPVVIPQNNSNNEIVEKKEILKKKDNEPEKKQEEKNGLERRDTEGQFKGGSKLESRRPSLPKLVTKNLRKVDVIDEKLSEKDKRNRRKTLVGRIPPLALETDDDGNPIYEEIVFTKVESPRGVTPDKNVSEKK